MTSYILRTRHCLGGAFGPRLYRSFLTSKLATSTYPQAIKALSDSILMTNWADHTALFMVTSYGCLPLEFCISLVSLQNMALWSSQMKHLESFAETHSVDENTQTNLRRLQKLMDCMARASDVRDHLNELMEYSSRASGIAGVGILAQPKPSNMKEHLQLAIDEYEDLRRTYPEYATKLRHTVGQGLALMRQKQRFDFPTLHEHFF